MFRKTALTVALLTAATVSTFTFSSEAAADIDLGSNYKCTADNKITSKGKVKTLKQAQQPLKTKVAANKSKISALKGKKNSKNKIAALKAKNEELNALSKNLSLCTKGTLTPGGETGNPTPNPAWQTIVGTLAGQYDFHYSDLRPKELDVKGDITVNVSLNGPIVTFVITLGGNFAERFGGANSFTLSMDIRDSKFTYPKEGGSSNSVPFEFPGTPFGKLKVNVRQVQGLATTEISDIYFDVTASEFPVAEFFNFYNPSRLGCTVALPMNTTWKDYFFNCTLTTPIATQQSDIRSADISLTRP